MPHANDKNGIKLPLTAFHVWALGITVVIGGQYFGWNAGLVAGFGSFTLAFTCIGIAYFCLCSCVAELSSCVPFAGGTYGLARCTFGGQIGFLVGCCEAFEYMIYVAISAVSLGDMFVSTNPAIENFQPLIWFSFYLTSLYFHVKGGKLFWNFSSFLGVVSILMLLIFVFGSLKYVDFYRYAELQSASSETAWFNGGMVKFMQILPLPAWFFVGIESLNMICEDATNPKKVIPSGQMWCIVTLLITAILVLFVCVSLPPGIDLLSGSLVPLNTGFSLMFGLAPRLCSLLSLPATYATAYGFIYAYGKLLVAMAESHLLPPFLAVRYGENETAAAALVTGSVISLAICFICRYNTYVASELFNLCMLCSFTAYISQCVGFMHLRYHFKFSSNADGYRSPLGYSGACLSIIIWVLGVISIVAFQTSPFAIVAYCTIVLGLSLYYHLYARHHAVLSANENEILFFAHWIHLQHYNVDQGVDENYLHVNTLHDTTSLDKIKTVNAQRMHPDVVGAAKLNLLREYGKIGGSLADDKNGGALTEAEVQRLRLLYSTPSKNWFNSAPDIDARQSDKEGRSSKWRIGRQEGNSSDQQKSKDELQKQQQFDLLMSYQDKSFYDATTEGELLQPPTEHAPIPTENDGADDELDTHRTEGSSAPSKQRTDSEEFLYVDTDHNNESSDDEDSERRGHQFHELNRLHNYRAMQNGTAHIIRPAKSAFDSDEGEP